ncbi:ATP-binding protein [Prochlorothrix hollandica]|uniref:ATP-binding protein n=1 Tax=Prochlorothrix hollandica TaxID=1223 RepID=UPI0003475490|nr:ATP-binding protein [Prochlorothrix hollandica]
MLALHQEQIDQAIAALLEGESILLLGEPGSGKSTVARSVQFAMEEQGYTVANSTYLGASKALLIEIAEALGIPLEQETESGKTRQLSADDLRREIGYELKRDKVLLICDDAERWPQSARYWLEACWKDKALLMMIADRPQASGIFVKIPRISLDRVSPDQARSVMAEEASTLGVSLKVKDLAALQERVGGNPALARRVVREYALGMGEDQAGTDHYRYVDGTPFLVAALGTVAIVRFVGLGLGDRSLYILGGVAMTLMYVLRTLLGAINKKSTRLGRQ